MSQGLSLGHARLAHVLDGHDDLEIELLRDARVDELDLACARDEAADLLHRALRRGQADALERLLDEPLQPLHRQRQVRAALRARDGVHLVEDQRPDSPQVLARARGQQEVERLRRGDQDVRRVPEHLRPLLLRRVAGADGDAQLRLEPRERPAQVALDVVVERLQRRDVDQPQAGVRAPDGACRSRRGRRRASSPSPSAPGSACACRSRSPASRAAAPASARRMRPRTRRASQG